MDSERRTKKNSYRCCIFCDAEVIVLIKTCLLLHTCGGFPRVCLYIVH